MKRKASTLLQDLKKRLCDLEKQYCDVTIECSDSVKLPGARLLLSARSKFFDNAFSQDEKKNGQTCTEIKVAVDSNIMREVLEFWHTDMSPTIMEVRRSVRSAMTHVKSALKQSEKKKKKKKDRSEDLPPRTVVSRKSLVRLTLLARAAQYLQFDALRTRTEATMKSLVKYFPYTACLVFETLWGYRGVSQDETPPQTIMHWFRYHPRFTLVGAATEPGGVKPRIFHIERAGYNFSANELKSAVDEGYGISELSPNAIRLLYSLIESNEKNIEYYFHILVAWSRMTNEIDNKDMLIQRTHTKEESIIVIEGAKERKRELRVEERLQAAKQIAFLMNYKKMRPVFIASVVEQSGLVDSGHMKRIYRRLLLPNFEPPVITIDQ